LALLRKPGAFFGMAGVDSLFVGLYLVSFPSALFLGTQSIPNSITRFRPYSVFLFSQLVHPIITSHRPKATSFKICWAAFVIAKRLSCERSCSTDADRVQGSNKSTPGSNIPLAMNANIARSDCDILADSGSARSAFTTITSSAQSCSTAKAGCLWCKSFMILMHWRMFGDNEFCENHMVWWIISRAFWVAV